MPDDTGQNDSATGWYLPNENRHVSYAFDYTRDDAASMPPSSAGQSVNAPRVAQNFAIPTGHHDTSRMSLTPRTPMPMPYGQAPQFRQPQPRPNGPIGERPFSRIDPGTTRHSGPVRTSFPYHAAARPYARTNAYPPQQQMRDPYRASMRAPTREAIFGPEFGPPLNAAPRPEPSRPPPSRLDPPIGSFQPHGQTEPSLISRPMEVLRPGSSGHSFYDEYKVWSRPEVMLKLYKEILAELKASSFKHYNRVASYKAPGPWVDTFVDRPQGGHVRRNSGLLNAAFAHFYSMVDTLESDRGPTDEPRSVDDVLQMLQSVNCPNISSLKKGVLKHFWDESAWYICLGSLHWLMNVATKARAAVDTLDKEDERNTKFAGLDSAEELETTISTYSLSIFALKQSGTEDAQRQAESALDVEAKEFIAQREAVIAGRRDELKKKEESVRRLEKRRNENAQASAEKEKLETEIAETESKLEELAVLDGKEQARLQSVEEEISDCEKEWDSINSRLGLHQSSIDSVREVATELEKLTGERDRITTQYRAVLEKLKTEARLPVEAAVRTLESRVSDVNANLTNKTLEVHLVEPLGSNFGASVRSLLGNRTIEELQDQWQQALVDVEERSRDNTQAKASLREELETLAAELASTRTDVNVLTESVSSKETLVSKNSKYLTNMAKDTSETTVRRTQQNDEKLRAAQAEYDEQDRRLNEATLEAQGLDQLIKATHPQKSTAASRIKLLTLIHDTIGTRLFKLTETVGTYIDSVSKGKERLSNVWPLPNPETKSTIPDIDSLRSEYRQRVAELAKRDRDLATS